MTLYPWPLQYVHFSNTDTWLRSFGVCIRKFPLNSKTRTSAEYGQLFIRKDNTVPVNSHYPLLLTNHPHSTDNGQTKTISLNVHLVSMDNLATFCNK